MKAEIVTRQKQTIISRRSGRAAIATAEASRAETQKDNSPAVALEIRSVAITSGAASHAISVGDACAEAMASGPAAVALTVGMDCSVSATGEHGIAIAAGPYSRARAGMGAAIMLAEYDDDDGALVGVRASMVGKNGIKPGRWYRLKDGKFVEAL